MSSAHPIPRYLELDLLRTIAIVLMIIYHAAFDLSYFFGFPFDPTRGWWLALQRTTANLFLLLVGVSFVISWNAAIRRGATPQERILKAAKRTSVLLACAMLVTAATYALDPATYVRFGVLHLIATASILLPILAPLREGNILLAIVVWSLRDWTLHLTDSNSLLLPLGLQPAAFASVDYFPLIPWLSPILVGLSVGHVLYVRRILRLHLPHNRAWRLLTAPGQYALAIYLIHQPVLLSIFWFAERFLA